MINNEDLYIYDVAAFTENLYRMGNSAWPAFTEERAKSDVLITMGTFPAPRGGECTHSD